MRKSSPYRFALGRLPFVVTDWLHRPVGTWNASVLSKLKSRVNLATNESQELHLAHCITKIIALDRNLIFNKVITQ